MSYIPKATVEFQSAEDVGPREWGREILIAHAPGKYIGKLLEMKKGHGGNLQMHQLKDETSYVLKGEYEFTYDKGDGTLTTVILGPGSCVRIPPGAVHRGIAHTDCTIVEFSTPHFNDRVRMFTEYGLPDDGGLPSTRIDEIEVR
jgi:quercetin dioxygenase-like cupin family protein